MKSSRFEKFDSTPSTTTTTTTTKTTNIHHENPNDPISIISRHPIARIQRTNHPQLNGSFVYIRSYNTKKERYTAIPLDFRTAALAHFTEESIDWNSRGVVSLPPSSVAHLTFLDIMKLFLRYSVSPLEYCCCHFTECLSFQYYLVPSWSFSRSLCLLIAILLSPWFLRQYRYQVHVLRPFDLITLASILLGTRAIVRFVLLEYRIVQRKADSIHETNTTFSMAEMMEYRVDYYFSTTKWAKAILLLSLTFILIAAGAALLAIASEDHSLSSAAWIAWTFVADPGVHADTPPDLWIRSVSFAITLGGMVIFALMIGIISDGIGEKVDDLKKGKSRVIESGHSVMLGWNDKSLAIIQQIALANESEGGGTIVVLADAEKESLEKLLNSAVSSVENPLRLLGTEVIFRSGNPLLECELNKISIGAARSVISLSRTQEDMDPDEADANQVRQVMALKSFEAFQASTCHVVVEIQDVDNAELCALVAPNFAEVVVTNDMIGRLMLQCARCPGLSSVLEEMLGFEGSEFYFDVWPDLVEKTFYEITCRFDDAIPVGIKSSDGTVLINPENDCRVREGDQILVLAEDNDSYRVNDGSYTMTRRENSSNSPPNPMQEKKIEKILFCGWRRDMADMITQLDEYVERGSQLWLFNMVPVAERAELLKDKGNKTELDLKNLSIHNVVGNPIIRRDLNCMNALDTNGYPTGHRAALDQFDSILILADAVAIERGANMMSCDSRSLSSLLIIQDLMMKQYEARRISDPNIKRPCYPVSEILDTRTKSLLKVVHFKGLGYIMSNQIISAVMAMVSEEKDINIVLREILTAEGSETFVRPIGRFINLDENPFLSFWDVALLARQSREVAIGYKPGELEFEEASHLIINPPEKDVERKWSREDVVITFALD